MKWKRKKKPAKFQVLAFGGSATLFGGIIYLLFFGFSYIATALIAVATVALAGPSIAAGEGLFEVIASFIEMIIEGVFIVFEVVAEIVGALFNW